MKRKLNNLLLNSLVHLRHYFQGLTRTGSHQMWMTVFVVGTGGVLMYLVYLATLTVPDIDVVKERFSRLDQSFRRGGLPLFVRKKGELREQIERTLKVNKNRKARVIAANISLYLFPDLLPDNDFEKEEALTSWIPLQKAIEQNPRAHKSRLRFEKMKAIIWNYENPSRTSPAISGVARQVLEIYDALTAR